MRCPICGGKGPRVKYRVCLKCQQVAWRLVTEYMKGRMKERRKSEAMMKMMCGGVPERYAVGNAETPHGVEAEKDGLRIDRRREANVKSGDGMDYRVWLKEQGI